MDRSAEGRRRRTAFRKIRQFCAEFDIQAVVIMTDKNNCHWIYKTHDEVQAIDLASQHTRTTTHDDFHLVAGAGRKSGTKKSNNSPPATRNVPIFSRRK
ncbi:hypothetical protein BJX62DRAFT_196595 [Aspergillus germanicus]